MNRSDSNHHEDLVLLGLVARLDREACAALIDYLNSLPWVGTRLSWERLGGRELSLVEPVDVIGWAKAHSVGQYRFVAAVYSKSIGLVATPEAVFGNLDEIVRGYPGEWFFCGATSARPPELVLDSLAEYDGVETLTARPKDSHSHLP